jgi:hypothetical protein
MFIDPRTLMNQTIDDLQTLAAYLEDEVDERTHDQEKLTPEGRRCKEALMTINVLLPKLRAVMLIDEIQVRAKLPACVNCD